MIGSIFNPPTFIAQQVISACENLIEFPFRLRRVFDDADIRSNRIKQFQRGAQ